MAYTINTNEYQEIKRDRCIRQRDCKSLVEFAEDLKNTNNEYDILSIARKIIRSGERNEKARSNEANIERLKDKIRSELRHGDMFTAYSINSIIYNTGLVENGAHWYALLSALNDLVNNGELERKLMRHNNDSGSHVEVYIVK